MFHTNIYILHTCIYEHIIYVHVDTYTQMLTIDLLDTDIILTLTKDLVHACILYIASQVMKPYK